jgi:hypothetical protein
MEIVTKFCAIGQKIHNTHKEMYISAMYEENLRRTENKDGWTAGENMTDHQIARLSIFRVPAFFEKLDHCRQELRAWANTPNDDGSCNNNSKDDESLHILLKGDQIEADLGGSATDFRAWSPAKVVSVRSDGLFDIQLFDGQLKKGILREAIKGPHDGIGIFI